MASTSVATKAVYIKTVCYFRRRIDEDKVHHAEESWCDECSGLVDQANCAYCKKIDVTVIEIRGDVKYSSCRECFDMAVHKDGLECSFCERKVTRLPDDTRHETKGLLCSDCAEECTNLCCEYCPYIPHEKRNDDLITRYVGDTRRTVRRACVKCWKAATEAWKGEIVVCGECDANVPLAHMDKQTNMCRFCFEMRYCGKCRKEDEEDKFTHCALLPLYTSVCDECTKEAADAQNDAATASASSPENQTRNKRKLESSVDETGCQSSKKQET